jgi:hypothetical protein
LTFPTPYPEVNQVLQDFTTQIQSILGDQFIALYLYGSLALCDFDQQTSDIDFIVITRGEFPEEITMLLKQLHANFDSSSSIWAKRIEAVYIPLDALNMINLPEKAYPQLEKGLELKRMPLEVGWAFQLHSLSKYGIRVAGEEIRGTIQAVTKEDMRQASLKVLSDWLVQSQNDPEWIEWAHIRNAQAFIVLTLCRILYSLDTGDVISKSMAARWVQKALNGGWYMLIELSLAGQHDDRQTADNEYEEMVSMLRYSLEQCQN